MKYSLRTDTLASGLFLENRILKLNQLECKAFKVISKFAKRYNKTSEGSCRDVRSNKQNETKPKVTSR